MAIITTGNHPKAQWPGVHAWWGRFYNEHPEEWSQIFQIEKSTRNFEEDVKATGFSAAPVKEQGGSVKYDSETQGYTTRYVHVTYGLGYGVTREEMEDNLYEKVSKQRVQALAYSMRQTEEIVHANILNRAFDSDYAGGDGKELCATDHPNSVGGTFSNELAVAADLSEASLEDLIIQINGAKGAKDLNIKLMPECLIVPRQEWFNANRILKSTLQSDTANNDINVLKATNALPQGIKMNHYLTDTDAWFVKTNCPLGLMHYRRRAIEFTKDNDFNTENALAKATMRWSSGWTDPLTLFGSPGA